MTPPLVTYIVHTDRECSRCGEVHGYLTKQCLVVVYARRDTAEAVCEYHRIPFVNIEAQLGIPYELGAYVLDITDHGRRRHAHHPRHASLPRR
jgi:hypothetical protein